MLLASSSRAFSANDGPFEAGSTTTSSPSCFSRQPLALSSESSAARAQFWRGRNQRRRRRAAPPLASPTRFARRRRFEARGRGGESASTASRGGGGGSPSLDRRARMIGFGSVGPKQIDQGGDLLSKIIDDDSRSHHRCNPSVCRSAGCADSRPTSPRSCAGAFGPRFLSSTGSTEKWARAGKLAASKKGRARLWYKSSALEGMRANLKKGAADGAAAAITSPASGRRRQANPYLDCL